MYQNLQMCVSVVIADAGWADNQLGPTTVGSWTSSSLPSRSPAATSSELLCKIEIVIILDGIGDTAQWMEIHWMNHRRVFPRPVPSSSAAAFNNFKINLCGLCYYYIHSLVVQLLWAINILILCKLQIIATINVAVSAHLHRTTRSLLIWDSRYTYLLLHQHTRRIGSLTTDEREEHLLCTTSSCAAEPIKTTDLIIHSTNLQQVSANIPDWTTDGSSSSSSTVNSEGQWTSGA